MKIVLLSGSFRPESRSLLILNYIRECFGEYEFSLPSLDILPFFTDQITVESHELLAQLIRDVETADGIIICSPEYNHSVPAVLKNAIDWCSRPAFHSVLKDKPVTILTQSGSPAGGARAHAHLKIILLSTLSKLFPCYEFSAGTVEKEILTSGNEIVLNEAFCYRIKVHVEQFLQQLSVK